VGVQMHYAVLEVCILRTIAPRITDLIKIASANPEELDPNFPEHMAKLKSELEGAAESGWQQSVLEKAFLLHYVEFDDKEKEAAAEKYCPLIKAGADAALAVYEDRVGPALARLEHRWRFDPKTMPADIPKVGDQYRGSDISRFFGVPEGKYSLGLGKEWMTYKKKWPTMSQRLKGLSIGKFWSDPDVVGWFPGGGQLPELGRWYATMPTSNVASERAFGIVRSLEDDQRRRAGEDTISIETLAQYNGWVVELVQKKHGQG